MFRTASRSHSSAFARAGDPFWIEPGHDPGSYLVGGEMDIAAAEGLNKLTPPPGSTSVILDLNAVSTIESGAIQAILNLASRIDRQLVIARPSESVRTVLAIADAGGHAGIVIQD